MIGATRREEQMKGKKDFTRREFDEIRGLLDVKLKSSPMKQKSVREKIRKLKFYISDFGFSPDGFGPRQFDALQERGAVRVIGEGALERKESRPPITKKSSPVATVPPEN